MIMGETEVVKSNKVKVSGIPTNVFTVGADIHDRPHEVILVIPGNPGLGGFYVDFMRTLYNNLNSKTAIWCISHAGHYSLPGVFPLKGNEDLYGLNGQINHKMAFLEEFLPSSCKITFIGHSIGCKIILELMKELSLSHNQNGKSLQSIKQTLSVHKSYLLFPTIERMKQTPAGRFTWIQVAYFATILSWIGAILNLLPKKIKEFLVSLHVSKTSGCFQAAMDLVNYEGVQMACYMGYTELLQVDEPDIDSLRLFSDKIRFYNGSSDPWCPLEYPTHLKEKVPELDITFCQKNIPHAFVLGRSDDVANIVSDWFNADIKCNQ